jgi:hypothetical protein
MSPTSTDAAPQFVKRWRDRQADGLASGEGLIARVRDGGGKDQHGHLDPGVEDKRLLVQASEFAQVLRVGQRPTNTLSAILRGFWDRGDAENMTKESPLRATGAHVSIIGHITADELKAELTSTEASNGFANRFLFVHVKRSKLLPRGGNIHEELTALAPHIDRLALAIEIARTYGEMRWSEATGGLWDAEYEALSEGESGLVGAVLGRAEAQVVRLASLYALLDFSDEIGVEHLRAALAFWDYCAQSARAIFGRATGNTHADKILKALQGAGSAGLSRTEINGLFQGNATQKQIEGALDALRDRKLARSEREATGAGRPTERWRALVVGEGRSMSPTSLASEAFHGLAGDIVNTILPFTEAAAPALLGQLLVAFGSVIGRSAYFPVEATRHHLNMYIVLVGQTSKARKGTSWDHIARVFEAAEEAALGLSQ